MIRFIAPSSPAAIHEMQASANFLRQKGFVVTIDPQCYEKSTFFAGPDTHRAQALLRAALDPQCQIIWCARGGYGSLKTIEALPFPYPFVPKKLLIGYSDITILMHFAHTQWGWSCLHAPMPSMATFTLLGTRYWSRLKKVLQVKDLQSFLYQGKPLTFLQNPSTIKGELIGGNLTSLHSLLGTPFAPQTQGKILFLEDIHESFYRIDRMVHHMHQIGFFKGLKGIILGNFLRCHDHVPLGLKKPFATKNKSHMQAFQSKPSNLKPLRPTLSDQKALQIIFAPLKLPVAYGLPVGHGPQVEPLPLFSTCQITSKGIFSIQKW